MNNSHNHDSNNYIIPYIKRIKKIANNKTSHVILALDFLPMDNLLERVKEIIRKLHNKICGVKINFHIILPFSISELKEITKFIHSFNIQIIADIKLNDIYDTNKIVIDYLSIMGFDAIIVNPFIGISEMKKLVDYTHSKDMGIISLVHMSLPTAKEGFGLDIIKENNSHQKKEIKMYELLLEYSINSNVDGIVVGATYRDIMKKVSSLSNISIYSPGFFVQGGTINKDDLNGVSYYIIGRYLINSDDPETRLNEILDTINQSPGK